MTPLDPRFVPLQREVGWYVSGAASLALFVALFVVLGVRRWYLVLPLWAAASAAVAVFAYRWPVIQYRYTGYRVDEHGIEIVRGVWWRAVSTVPRSRVQHTDVSQGPFERKYGLGRLVIYTAGTAFSRVELPGLAHETALGLRDHLLPREQSDAV